MHDTTRSDSYSESVKQEAQPLTTTSIISNRRATTIGNIHRGSIYFPAVSEFSSNTKSMTTSISM
jgi:hypothetical protein